MSATATTAPEIRVVITDTSENDRLLVQADWPEDRRTEMNAWISRWLRYMTHAYTATITNPDGTIKVRGAKKAS